MTLIEKRGEFNRTKRDEYFQNTYGKTEWSVYLGSNDQDKGGEWPLVGGGKDVNVGRSFADSTAYVYAFISIM